MLFNRCNFKIPSFQLIKHLMRLHTPTGYLLLFWPCAWGVLLGEPTISQLLWLPVFLLGAILMRGAGCIINDLTDREIDKHVERTKSRPIATGQVSRSEALVVIVLLLIPSFFIWLALPYRAKIVAMCGVVMLVLYPWFKRFSRCPQLFLGLTFNLGVLIGAYSVSYSSISTWYLYAAAVAWTIGYDTIYALQDKADDIKIGVKSFAVTLGEDVIYGITNCYKVTLVLFTIVGLVNSLGLLYFVGVVISALLLMKQISTLETVQDNLSNYQKIFTQNNLVGLVIAFAILLGN